jgi:hypothetical protein
MHARVATFHNDPDKIDGAIAKIRENIDAGMPTMPELADAQFLMLANRETGTMLGIALFDTEEAMRAGDVAMNAGPGQAGSRSAVEFYEVAIHTLDQRWMAGPCHPPPEGPTQRPNQRALRLAPNSSFSATSAPDGSRNVPVGFGPDRKSTSTRPTRPAPNSM